MAGDEATTTVSANESSEKIQSAIKSLSSIAPSLSNTTAASLLSKAEIYSEISGLLRRPESGAGDNNLCRWLYDTFQAGVLELQLLVLRFLPVIAGVYLSRVGDRKPQAGFEAVLLALYAHETNSRAGQAVSVTILDLPQQPSLYHRLDSSSSKTPVSANKNNNHNNNNNNNNNVFVVSPTLEPHGTVRSTRRARIVGVALELFYAKITDMPVSSKIDFCEFCKMWAGEEGEMYKKFEEEVLQDVALEETEKKAKMENSWRVPLPWELLEPVLRIVGHCLLGNINKKDINLFEAASEACRCLLARSIHDVNPKAILPCRSLLRLSKTLSIPINHHSHHDPTDLPFTDVISL